MFIDLTEFFERPNRTGIQRVCGELCVHWPAAHRLVPVRVAKNGQLIRLPSKGLEVVKAFFEGDAFRGENLLPDFQRRLKEAEKGAKPIALRSINKLLVPEVFFDPTRITFYEEALKEWASKIFFIVYDLCPLIAPDQYLPGSGAVIFPYYRLIQNVTHVGFISNSTRKDYFTRLLRREELNGPVFYLGSDGLGPRPVSCECSGERLFSVLSTIEPRKNHALILDAFEQLWCEFPDIELNFIGRLGWVNPTVSARITAMARSNRRFHWFDSVSDPEVRQIVSKSRATIYLSAKEGFGLPAVESLWLGVPVITNGVPSVESFGERAVYRIKELSSKDLKEAVVQFLDDDFLRRKRDEVKELRLPTWNAFANEVATWTRGEPVTGVDQHC